MITLNKEQIEKINKTCFDKCGWENGGQGIFCEPYGIPVHIKEPVIYMRWITGGVSGGSCWEDSNPLPYTNEKEPDFIALNETIKELNISLTFNQYEVIKNLIQYKIDSEAEYYGNSTDYETKYIILSTFLEKVNSFFDS